MQRERGGRDAPVRRASATKPPKRPQASPPAERLAAGRADLTARHNVSRETLERLDRYVALLLEWQAKTNLVAPSTLGEIWSRHIEDSLQLHQLAPGPMRWVDLGSGAGFPGLVIAIADAGRPGAHVDLIESNDKKAAFLRAVISETGLSAGVHAARIEDCGAVLGKAQAVSARALASLDALLGFVYGRIPREIPCYFAKGRHHEQEIVDASQHWRFNMVKHVSEVEAGAAILEIRDVERAAGPAA